MLTREEIDLAFAQPGENGYGKSRYDIADLLEKAFVSKLLSAEAKPTVYKVGDDSFVGAEDLVWFQHTPTHSITPLYTETQLRIERQKVAHSLALVSEARQKIDALERQLTNAEKSIRTLQKTLELFKPDVFRLDFIQHAAEASSTGVSFEYIHVVEDGLSIERGFRIRQSGKTGEWLYSVRAALDAELGEATTAVTGKADQHECTTVQVESIQQQTADACLKVALAAIDSGDASGIERDVRLWNLAVNYIVGKLRKGDWKNVLVADSGEITAGPSTTATQLASAK